ncbi:MAG: sensor histidine kinase, partial [Methanobacterium sp.]
SKEKHKEEMEFKSDDGTIIPIDISIKFFKDLDSFYAIITDLSYYKLTQEQLEEYAIEILDAYQTIKENEIKLKETVADLERSNEELQSFAYITSHDLQEPLRSIASYAQLIKRRYKGRLDSDADEFIDFMVAGATRMKEQIQGLFEYSRIDQADIDFKETDMDLIVERAVSNLNFAVDESKAEITYDNLPTVNVDPDQIVSVLQNFIGNAIKFRKPQFPPRIHISAEKDFKKHEWVFKVIDNGIGMESQYTDNIFEVFKRIHPIGEYKGTGIGLAIAKRIIERHGGRIWVESELGVGSVFYFSIPIRRE